MISVYWMRERERGFLGMETRIFVLDERVVFVEV